MTTFPVQSRQVCFSVPVKGCCQRFLKSKRYLWCTAILVFSHSSYELPQVTAHTFEHKHRLVTLIIEGNGFYNLCSLYHRVSLATKGPVYRSMLMTSVFKRSVPLHLLWLSVPSLHIGAPHSTISISKGCLKLEEWTKVHFCLQFRIPHYRVYM